MSSILSPFYWGYAERLRRQVIADARVPKHLGLILDGNRRYARELGLAAIEGHRFGVKKAYEVLEWCWDLKIPTVTLWVFSTENFKRDPHEVKTLMDLFVLEAGRMLEDARLRERQIRVKIIGERGQFPPEVFAAFEKLENETRGYDNGLLQIAMGYGGRAEIVEAVRSVIRDEATSGQTGQEIADKITEDKISSRLYTAGVADPDFIIRTSGEVRLSGFLLWQSAYSEYYFFDANWPAFRRIDFLRAIRSFQARQRRFGK